jgi:hypothetical protein
MCYSFKNKEKQFFALHKDFNSFFLRGMKEIDGKLFIGLSKKIGCKQSSNHCLILEYDLESQSIYEEHFLDMNETILDIG